MQEDLNTVLEDGTRIPMPTEPRVATDQLSEVGAEDCFTECIEFSVLTGRQFSAGEWQTFMIQSVETRDAGANTRVEGGDTFLLESEDSDRPFDVRDPLDNDDGTYTMQCKLEIRNFLWFYSVLLSVCISVNLNRENCLVCVFPDADKANLAGPYSMVIYSLGQAIGGRWGVHDEMSKARSPFSGISIVPSAPYGPQSTVRASSLESSTTIYVSTSFTVQAYDRYGNMRHTAYCQPAVGDIPTCTDVSDSLRYDIEVHQTNGVDTDGRSPQTTSICLLEDVYEKVDPPNVLSEYTNAAGCNLAGAIWDTEVSSCLQVTQSLSSACPQTIDNGDGTYTASYIPQFGGDATFQIKFASVGSTYLPSAEPQVLTADDVYLPQTYTSFSQILVTGVSPDTGPVTGNTTIEVSFQSWFIWPEEGRPSFECRFGDITAPATFISSGTVSCMTPAIPEGMYVTVDLQVVGGPSGFTSSLVKFKYFDLPVLVPLNLDDAPKVQFTLRFVIPGFQAWVSSKANARTLFGNAVANDLAQPFERPSVGLTLPGFSVTVNATAVLSDSGWDWSGRRRIQSGYGDPSECVVNCPTAAVIIDLIAPTQADIDAGGPATLTDLAREFRQRYESGTIATAAGFTSIGRLPGIGLGTESVTPGAMDGGLYATQYYAPAAGGSLVSIQGDLLDEGNDPRCSIGSEHGAVPVSVARRVMICQAPANADLSDLSVRISLNGQQYMETPVIVSYFRAATVLPALGLTTGGTMVVIGGENIPNEPGLLLTAYFGTMGYTTCGRIQDCVIGEDRVTEICTDVENRVQCETPSKGILGSASARETQLENVQLSVDNGVSKTEDVVPFLGFAPLRPLGTLRQVEDNTYDRQAVHPCHGPASGGTIVTFHSGSGSDSWLDTFSHVNLFGTYNGTNSSNGARLTCKFGTVESIRTVYNSVSNVIQCESPVGFVGGSVSMYLSLNDQQHDESIEWGSLRNQYSFFKYYDQTVVMGVIPDRSPLYSALLPACSNVVAQQHVLDCMNISAVEDCVAQSCDWTPATDPSSGGPSGTCASPASVAEMRRCATHVVVDPDTRVQDEIDGTAGEGDITAQLAAIKTECQSLHSCRQPCLTETGCSYTQTLLIRVDYRYSCGFVPRGDSTCSFGFSTGARVGQRLTLGATLMADSECPAGGPCMVCNTPEFDSAELFDFSVALNSIDFTHPVPFVTYGQATQLVATFIDALDKTRTHTILTSSNETALMNIRCQAQDQAGNTALEDINNGVLVQVRIVKGSYTLQGDFIADDPNGNGRAAWSSDYMRSLVKAQFDLEPGDVLMYRPLAGDYRMEMRAIGAIGGDDVLSPSLGQLTLEVTPGVTYVPNCEVVSLRFGRELCGCDDGSTDCLRTQETYLVYVDDAGQLIDDETLSTFSAAELANMTTEDRTRRNPDTCWNIVNPKTRFEVRIRTVDIAGNYRRAGGDTVRASFRVREKNAFCCASFCV